MNHCFGGTHLLVGRRKAHPAGVNWIDWYDGRDATEVLEWMPFTLKGDDGCINDRLKVDPKRSN
jgi:hypothetical protein